MGSDSHKYMLRDFRESSAFDNHAKMCLRWDVTLCRTFRTCGSVCQVVTDETGPVSILSAAHTFNEDKLMVPAIVGRARVWGNFIQRCAFGWLQSLRG